MLYLVDAWRWEREVFDQCLIQRKMQLLCPDITELVRNAQTGTRNGWICLREGTNCICEESVLQ